MKKGYSCSILRTHEDVVTEISLRLPVQSLFRCRAVCKLWRDVINSPFFRKLHIRSSSNKEEEDEYETVYVQLNYDGFRFGSYSADVKVSMTKILDNGNGKSLILNLKFDEGFPSLNLKCIQQRWLGMAVKGLICFYWSTFVPQPIAMWNPFLGQIRTLPSSPILTSSNSNYSCKLFLRDIGIGCDEEFYKVVEVVHCYRHRCFHAHLYSRRTDSWRELVGLDQQICKIFPVINFTCNDGHFAHWYGGDRILTFDMKNEVFRTTKVQKWIPSFASVVVAKDDGDSFILIVQPHTNDELVRIYESSISICEEGKGIRRILTWNHVVNLENPFVLPTPTTPLPLLRRDCVILKIFYADGRVKMLLYNYRVTRFIECFYLPVSIDFFYYKGTFISP